MQARANIRDQAQSCTDTFARSQSAKSEFGPQESVASHQRCQEIVVNTAVFSRQGPESPPWRDAKLQFCRPNSGSSRSQPKRFKSERQKFSRALKCPGRNSEKIVQSLPGSCMPFHAPTTFSCVFWVQKRCGRWNHEFGDLRK